MELNNHIPFHSRFKDLTDNPSRDEALCGLMALQALFDGQADDGRTLFDVLNEPQGSFETREEALAMGVHVERCYRRLLEHYGDDFNDTMHEVWGCYDYGWVPEMVELLIKNPETDLVEHCISKIEGPSTSDTSSDPLPVFKRVNDLDTNKAIRYIVALDAQGLSYHFDDRAADCLADRVTSGELDWGQVAIIQANIVEITQLDWAESVFDDPFDVLLHLSNGDEYENSLSLELRQWQDANRLPHECAMEQLAGLDSGDGRRLYLSGFVSRWGTLMNKRALIAAIQRRITEQ